MSLFLYARATCLHTVLILVQVRFRTFLKRCCGSLSYISYAVVVALKTKLKLLHRTCRVFVNKENKSSISNAVRSYLNETMCVSPVNLKVKEILFW